MEFKIWTNHKNNQYVDIDIPVAELRTLAADSPSVLAYLDWHQETGMRGPHAGEGVTHLWVKAHREELDAFVTKRHI